MEEFQPGDTKPESDGLYIRKYPVGAPLQFCAFYEGAWCTGDTTRERAIESLGYVKEGDRYFLSDYQELPWCACDGTEYLGED